MLDRRTCTDGGKIGAQFRSYTASPPESATTDATGAVLWGNRGKEDALREIAQERDRQEASTYLPAPRPRATKPIPIAAERLALKARNEAKQAAQQARDERARLLAAAESQVILGPTRDISSSDSSDDNDSPILLPASPPQDLPPSSTAPPRLEQDTSTTGRSKKARGRTLDYAKLDAGDSQKYKKAKARKSNY
ncbi:hypothetical protein H2198_006836 [Neophaeococcomyces mojaviensis]|uniref:Uncharacterized protein n=1 Tax=Neophaeococcomyces mojaviensis TaxID=3383035 RepID=A0ACC3A1W9_9EURO|nr:hypothetical protein H2198_006836 [Knufia sp. JES_112]